MSVQQYGRKVSLIIGGPADGNAAGQDAEAIELSGLRIVFRVQRGDTETPNTLQVRIYNVSENTSQRIEREYSRIVLQAGYAGNYGIIFDGSVKQVRRGREQQTDTYLDISAADGDAAYNFAVMNTSLAAGATREQQVNACLAEMEKHGVSKGYVPDLGGNSLPRGKVLFGMARDKLGWLAKTAETLWSIQDGKLQMVPETSYIPGDIPVINADTGLVGLPEQTRNGISVRLLLNPYMKIGRLIQLDNRSIQRYENSLASGQVAAEQAANAQNRLHQAGKRDGFYYVMQADHKGDTHGQDWYTALTCLAVDATVADQQAVQKSAFGGVASAGAIPHWP